MSEFTFNLLQTLWAQQNKNENLTVSPLGITAVLSMCHYGARGRTQQQLAAVLGEGSLSAPTWENALYRFNHSSAKTKVQAANSLWVKDEIKLKQDFVEQMQARFHAQVVSADFNNPQTLSAINSWVQNHTDQKIKQIIDEPIPGDARSILINAIYFKGKWAREFESSQTTESTFLNSDGTSSSVAMMKSQGHFQYFESESIQVLDLPYEDGPYSMLLILPNKASDLNSVVSHLDLKTFSHYVSGLESKKGILELPKFNIQFAIKLKDTLIHMGITDAFDNDDADFSAISDSEPLKIDDIIHKTFFEVNEEGTEAAAATAGGIMRVTSIDLDFEPSFYMKADHPFLFAIRNRETGMILFLGTFSHSP